MYLPGQYESLVRDVNKRYTDSLMGRNPGLIQAAVNLHQSGEIPPNTYLFDLDAHRRNARIIFREARKQGISLYYMTKQIGRNPVVCRAVLDEGFGGVVAVEAQEAQSLHRYGIRMGHVGHLVQIPTHSIDHVLAMEPEVWTVYSVENAKAISERVNRKSSTQNLLIQPVGKDDTFLETETGGIPEEMLVEAVRKIDNMAGVKVVGTTSFPCLMYDLRLRQNKPMPNFTTAVRAARTLEGQLGKEITQVNVSPNVMNSTLRMIAANGGTHGEPGLSVSGSNTTQVLQQEQEMPAFVYVTEVSHSVGNKAYAYGGGMAFPGSGFGILPDGNLWFGLEDGENKALVGRSPDSATSNSVRLRYPGMDPFNYYYTLYEEDRKLSVGDTVLFGLCSQQVFVSRSYTAAVAGIEDNDPRLLGIFDRCSNLVDEQGRSLGEGAATKLIQSV